MQYTPEIITALQPDEIFVFGSNLAGIHGAGAAKVAYEKFGAVWGEGEGLYGQSYAFPTKDDKIQTLDSIDIAESVVNFIETCEAFPKKTFLLTKVGCGLAGLDIDEMASLFKGIELPKNIVLPKEFADIIYESK